MRTLAFGCLALVVATACTDPEDAPEETGMVSDALAAGCKKMVKVSLRTNYGIEAFDPARQAGNEYPNHCWLETENIDSSTWRRCSTTKCEPTTGKLHWYYDDTSVFSTAFDKAEIARVDDGMGSIKGTVDMANRGDGWSYFQMNANGHTDVIDRWFAETHSAAGDHLGCQFQENNYIDEWAAFEHAVDDPRIRPQLVVISADHRCPVDDAPLENCPQAYLQIKHACSLVGSGRTLGITAEGGHQLQYGHCLGDVIKAINECTCERSGGCF